MYERIFWGILIFQIVLFLVTMILSVIYVIISVSSKLRNKIDKIEDKKEALENAAGYSFNMFGLLCFVLMGILLAANGQIV